MESSSPPTTPTSRSTESGVSVHVLWDLHSVPLPPSVPMSFACSRLRSLAASYGRLCSLRLLAAAGRVDEAERSAVRGCGGECVEWRSDKGDSAASSLFLLTHLCHLALSLSRSTLPSSTARPVLVVVSGDVDLSHAVSLMRQSELFGEVVLVHPQRTAESLLHCATLTVDWLHCLGVSAAAEVSDSARGQDEAREARAEGEAGADGSHAAVSPGHSRRSSSDSLSDRTGERVTAEPMTEEKTSSEDALNNASRSSSTAVGEGSTHPLTVSDEFEQMAHSVAKMGLTPSPTTRPLSPSLSHPHPREQLLYDAFQQSSFPAATQWEQLSNTAAFSPSMHQEGYGKQGPAANAAYASPAAYHTTSLPLTQTTDPSRLQQHFSDPELAYAEAQRLLVYQQQQQQMVGLSSHPPRFYSSTAQSAVSKSRQLSSTAGPAPLPLLVQPSIPLPVQSSAAMRASDRPSPRHRQFIAVFHRVLAYCEQEKIIPRESVVKKRLLDSKLSMDVDFEEFLAVVEDSGNAVIEGEAPQRVIWPRLSGEGGGARRFACADFFQPSQRLSSDQTHDLLMFLAQVQPTIDRGRFGFAQWLARHGPKFIQLLPHGVLVELVQLLLNQKVLLFRKGKVSVSPQLNSDPSLFINAINSAQGAEGGTGGATGAGPLTPPHTPPSQPQWPTSSASFSHLQQQTPSMPYPHQHQHAQSQLYPSMYAQQLQQQTPPAMRGGWGVRPMVSGMEGGGSQYGEFDDDDFVTRSVEGGIGDLSDRLTASEGKLRSKEAIRDRLHMHKGYKTWPHPNAFPIPFPTSGTPQMSTPPSQSSLVSSTAASTPLSSPSPPSSAPSTPLPSAGSTSPFPHPIGRPRMMSMPPQIPRPPSNLAGQTTPPSSDGGATPSRVPSRSSQAAFGFSEATTSTPLVSPKAQEKSGGSISDVAVGGVLQLGSQSTPARTTNQLYNSSGSGSGGAQSRKSTPHTSPVLTAQAPPSFSTRPSSPFEFGLPITAVDAGVFSTLSADKDDKQQQQQHLQQPRPPSSGLPPVPAGSRVDSRLKSVRSLNITSPPSSNGSPMSHTASLSILSSLASTTSPSVPVTPNSTSFFSSHSPMSQAGGSQPNSADSGRSSSSRGGGGGGRFYSEGGGESEGSRPRSVSNPVEPYQPSQAGGVSGPFPHGQLASGAKRGVMSSHQRHHSTSANQQSYEVALAQHQREQQLQHQQQQQQQQRADHAAHAQYQHQAQSKADFEQRQSVHHQQQVQH